MTSAQELLLGRLCNHLRWVADAELAAGNLIDWIDNGGDHTVIKLKQSFSSTSCMARPPVVEQVVADPHWWGRELHCPEHHQRLVSPL